MSYTAGTQSAALLPIYPGWTMLLGEALICYEQLAKPELEGYNLSCQEQVRLHLWNYTVNFDEYEDENEKQIT